MKRAIILGVVVVVPLWACGQSTSNGGSSTAGAGGTTGGTNNGGSIPNTGGAPNTGGVCNVSIRSEAGATCDLVSPLDAGGPLDAGPASDLSKLGPYAVGHVSYALSDTTLYPRTVMAGVWYPVDPGTLTSATPPAQYPLDEWAAKLPVSTSRDWEALGYDPAYEGPAPSRNQPFPLVIVAPGSQQSIWEYLYIGPRLASHGFVVAIISHDSDGQYPWIPSVDLNLFNRPRDASFAITALLQKNDTIGELLHGVVDPSKIAGSGHSLGGYEALALAGGDDEICQTEPAVDGGQPQLQCAPVPPDPRIKAIVGLDASSWAMRYYEMARISVPSLIIGETVEHFVSYMGATGLIDTQLNPRTHAAINRGDSYRVDVTLANHISFSNRCDGPTVMSSVGVDASTQLSIFGSDFNSSSSRCGTDGGFDPTTNPATHQIVTTYMLAFLNTYLGREDDSWMLTSSYARQYQPNVEFFDAEACNECPVQDSEFSYRPHPCQCSVGQKEPW